ncbi:MAG TPA: CBS domain-containing protein [Acidimicrobiia bacterium]|nr:CBS domain-containing protein [Acidimicrobiia bacterium]
MSIFETLNETPVTNLDLTRFVTVSRDTSIADTVEAMTDQGESCACVLDGDALVGIFTQRDALRVVGRPSAWSRPISDEMTPLVKTIDAQQTVADGLAIMTDWWVRSVPVLEAGKLVGNLSFYTIMRLIAEGVRSRATDDKGIRLGFSLMDFTGFSLSAPVTVRPDDTVDVAVHQMRARAIGSVLVVDERESLIGLVTEYDALTRLGCRVEDLSTVTIADVMTPDPVAVTARSPLADAIVSMAEKGYSHVPILGETGRPVGVASFRDLATYFETMLAALAP